MRGTEKSSIYIEIIKIEKYHSETATNSSQPMAPRTYKYNKHKHIFVYMFRFLVENNLLLLFFADAPLFQ